MRIVCSRTAPHFLSIAGLLAAAAGCGVSQKYYEVTSHPDGATIFLDEVQKGTTDEERLLVSFPARGYVTLRVERAGYQTEGVVLTPELNGPVRFYLKEAPQADKVFRKLVELEAKLEQVSSRVNQLGAR